VTTRIIDDIVGGADASGPMPVKATAAMPATHVACAVLDDPRSGASAAGHRR
jgi:hypothetical protein